MKFPDGDTACEVDINRILLIEEEADETRQPLPDTT